jgi:hypothetical protein
MLIGRTGSRSGGDERVDWARLVPYLVHPTKVLIVETLAEADGSVSLEMLFRNEPPDSEYANDVLSQLGELLGSGAVHMRKGDDDVDQYFLRR